MADGFFREEVFRARREGWLGAVRLDAPRFGWAYFWVSIALLVIVLALLCIGSYTRREAVNGTLVPDRGLLTLTPSASGRVVRTFAKEGANVRAGQPLVEISGEQDSASLGDTQASVIAQLRLKRERLRSDIEEQRSLSQAQDRDLRTRIALLKSQIASTEEQVVLQRQRAESAARLYEQWSSPGNRGVLTKVQLLQQQDVAIQNQAQLKDLQKRSLELRQQQSQLRTQLEQLPATLIGKNNEIDRQLADVAQSISESEARRAVILRAPSDGIVGNLLVYPGQPVAAQQPLMTLLPRDTRLRAELWVSSRAVGFVSPGDRVVLRYQAFPYQKFGRHAGRVAEISRSAMSSGDLTRLLGQDIKEQRYRVIVELGSQNVVAYGRQEPLRPGMALDADILLERRHLIEWMFEPVYELASGMRDTPSNERGS